MKVHIQKWHPVGYWHWNVRDPDDVCGICQNYFDGVCGACKDPGDACPLAVGECTHEFHLHCIMKWLSEKHEPMCPLCKRPWLEVSSTAPAPARSPASPGVP
ncbi:Similar to S.cerevisiae protein APC11 (Catalytic core subunit, Anaphase-Promoting Complex/Cyclosome (APC/C)) [Malassezia sympodialis ATCC 42132]|uniref:Anaphase-promoting complex subunit 11 n=1 Tax=Malassezia sympodialis (strain ATCC 42132) TaxID=1230383 RepID=A0A1M8AC67_MALS4|nr:Similar to S.cerevisiae protein APC11 (Catalytic core subunit, Anaphase-Promoting Complex/Cyclosome (APC/C)) [Malassezia sympodialis ATCC 42132]